MPNVAHIICSHYAEKWTSVIHFSAHPTFSTLSRNICSRKPQEWMRVSPCWAAVPGATAAAAPVTRVEIVGQEVAGLGHLHESAHYGQVLALVHSSAQPEPSLSLQLPIASHRKCLRRTEKWTCVCP